MKTFGAEAARRMAFLVDDLGFTGPVIADDPGALTRLTVSYAKDSITVRSSLVIGYMGEEYVLTEIIDNDTARTRIGEHTAHKGHEMRRALDRQSEALRAHLNRT